jgi:membrane protein
MGADLVGYCRWFGNQVHEHFTGYDCFKSASALTYTTLFSIVPIMAVGYRTLAFLPEYDQVGDIVSNFIFRNFVPESSAIVQSQLADFSSRALQLAGPSSIILFVTSFLLLVTIEKSFNDIWQIHERRKGWSRLVNYWAVLTIGPPLLVASIVGSTYLLTFPLVTENAPLISQVMLAWLPIIAAIATFTVLFYAVPNTVVPFKHALAGGVMTAILFEIGKLGFRFMVTQVDIASVYGTFAAVPFFLMWLYMVWLLILLSMRVASGSV